MVCHYISVKEPCWTHSCGSGELCLWCTCLCVEVLCHTPLLERISFSPPNCQGSRQRWVAMFSRSASVPPVLSLDPLAPLHQYTYPDYCLLTVSPWPLSSVCLWLCFPFSVAWLAWVFCFFIIDFVPYSCSFLSLQISCVGLSYSLLLGSADQEQTTGPRAS